MLFVARFNEPGQDSWELRRFVQRQCLSWAVRMYEYICPITDADAKNSKNPFWFGSSFRCQSVEKPGFGCAYFGFQPRSILAIHEFENILDRLYPGQVLHLPYGTDTLLRAVQPNQHALNARSVQNEGGVFVHLEGVEVLRWYRARVITRIAAADSGVQLFTMPGASSDELHFVAEDVNSAQAIVMYIINELGVNVRVAGVISGDVVEP